jgi:hypothetical protein
MMVLALAAGIDLGVVEEVDAGVEGGGHHLDGGLGIDLVGVGDPGAERQRADAHAGAAEAAVLHGEGPLARVAVKSPRG